MSHRRRVIARNAEGSPSRSPTSISSDDCSSHLHTSLDRIDDSDLDSECESESQSESESLEILSDTKTNSSENPPDGDEDELLFKVTSNPHYHNPPQSGTQIIENHNATVRENRTRRRGSGSSNSKGYSSARKSPTKHREQPRESNKDTRSNHNGKAMRDVASRRLRGQTKEHNNNIINADTISPPKKAVQKRSIPIRRRSKEARHRTERAPDSARRPPDVDSDASDQTELDIPGLRSFAPGADTGHPTDSDNPKAHSDSLKTHTKSPQVLPASKPKSSSSAPRSSSSTGSTSSSRGGRRRGAMERRCYCNIPPTNSVNLNHVEILTVQKLVEARLRLVWNALSRANRARLGPGNVPGAVGTHGVGTVGGSDGDADNVSSGASGDESLLVESDHEVGVHSSNHGDAAKTDNNHRNTAKTDRSCWSSCRCWRNFTKVLSAFVGWPNPAFSSSFSSLIWATRCIFTLSILFFIFGGLISSYYKDSCRDDIARERDREDLYELVRQFGISEAQRQQITVDTGVWFSSFSADPVPYPEHFSRENPPLVCGTPILGGGILLVNRRIEVVADEKYESQYDHTASERYNSIPVQFTKQELAAHSESQESLFASSDSISDDVLLEKSTFQVTFSSALWICYGAAWGSLLWGGLLLWRARQPWLNETDEMDAYDYFR
jgi:hypothetical protein